MLSWSAVPFGKYKGKALPEIIVRDLDWFFWAVPKLYGKLAEEAEELARNARAIKIPNSRRKLLEVEYQYEMGHRFCGFAFVTPTMLSILDGQQDFRTSICLRRKKYDKRAGRIMIQDFRIHYFGEHKRLTKERCKEFFSNERNFIDI